MPVNPIGRRRMLLGLGGVGLTMVAACTPEPGTDPSSTPSQGATSAVGHLCRDGLPEHANSVLGNDYSHDHARLSLSPDGALLAGGGRHRPDLLVWDTTTGEVAHRFEVGTVVRPVWLGVATLCWATDQAVVVVDLTTGTTHHFPQGGTGGGDSARPQVSDLVARPDGNRIALIGTREVLVADPASCEILQSHRLPDARAVGLTADALVVNTAGEVFTVDPTTGERADTLAESTFGPMAWAAGGMALVVVVEEGWTQEVRVLAPADGRETASAGLELAGQPLAVSADGALVAGALQDGSVALWRPMGQEFTTVVPGQQVSDVAVDPSGTCYVWGPDSLDAWAPGGGRRVSFGTD